MNKVEKFFAEKLKIIASQKEILDIGGGVRLSKELIKYKDWFNNSHYQVLDNNPQVKPDILADAHNIPLKGSSVDAVICKSVLEHVINPQKVMEEIYRILKPSGYCLIYVPFIYPYHGNKIYKDYFRFTKDGVELLINKFSHKEMVTMRGSLESICYFLPNFVYQILKFPARYLDNIFKKSNQTSGFLIFLRK